MPIQLEFKILKAKLMALGAMLCDFLVIGFVQLNDSNFGAGGVRLPVTEELI
jgi:hypothetical protein